MGTKSNKGWSCFLLVIPWVLIGLGLRLWHALLQLAMFRDETTYAFQIKHVLKGTIFSDPTYFIFPPTYAFLSAPVALLTGDPELAGRLVSCVLGAATAIPVFCLARDLFGLRAAAVAGFLAAVFPSFSSSGVMSEATYGFFVALSLYLANRARVTHRTTDFLMFGLAMGFCYLSRPEGFFVFFACLAVLAAYMAVGMTDRKKAALLLLSGIAGFMLFSFPYMVQLREHYGAWEISGKTRINLAKAKAKELATPGDDIDKLDSRVLADMEKNRPDLGTNLVREFSAMAKRYPGNLVEELKDFPAVAGYMLIFAYIIGAAFALRHPGSFWGVVLLAAGLTPLLLIPAVFILSRILVPYLPVVFVLGGYGVARLAEIAGGKMNRYLDWQPLTYVLTGAMATMMLLGQFGAILPETDTAKVRMSDGLYDYYCTLREIGQEIKPTLPPDSVILTRDNVLAYYAGGEYIPIPPADDIKGLLSYAKQNRAGYLFYGPMEQQLRPRLGDYLIGNNGSPVDDPLGDGSMKLVNYSDIYLLYKLDPRGVS